MHWAHGHLHGICIEVATLIPIAWNMLHGHLLGSGHFKARDAS